MKTRRSAVLVLAVVVGVCALLVLGAQRGAAAAIKGPQPINICGLGQVGNPSTVLFNVPVDTRLEIEYGSIHPGEGLLVDGQRVTVTIGTIAGGAEGHFLVGEIEGPHALDNDARLMKVFADAGTTVTVQQGTSGPSNPGAFLRAAVCLSARLVPVSQ
jgi:hypothetical protein